MSKYHLTKAVFTVEGPKGNPKKVTETYLVSALSCTEAESRLTSYLTERGENDFEIKETKESKIVEVIEVPELG